LTDARKGAITDGLTKAASMIGVGHEVFKGLVRVAQPGRAPEGAQPPRQPQQPRTIALAAQQPPSAPHAAQQPPVDPGTGSQNGNGKNGAGHHPVDPGTGFRNGGSNGTARAQAEVGTGLLAPGVPAGFRASGGNGNGAATPTIQATPTTYWLKANDHANKLDRAQVSSLAKQVIDGKLSWQEAQSRLDDWIDAAVLPSFAAANGAAVKAPVAASVKPMTERASDPLDELFE
jgi:hypothetical protein